MRNPFAIAMPLILLSAVLCAAEGAGDKSKNISKAKPHWVRVGNKTVDANKADGFNRLELGTRKVKLKKKAGVVEVEEEREAKVVVVFSKDKSQFIEQYFVVYPAYEDTTADTLFVMRDEKGKETVVQVDDSYSHQVEFLSDHAILVALQVDNKRLLAINKKGEIIFDHRGEFFYQLSPLKDGFLYTKYTKPEEQVAGLYKFTAGDRREKLLFEYKTGHLGFSAVFLENGYTGVALDNNNLQLLLNEKDGMMWSTNYEMAGGFLLSPDKEYLLTGKNWDNIALLKLRTGELVWERDPIVHDGIKYFYSKWKIVEDKIMVPLKIPLPTGHRVFNRTGLTSVFDLKTGKLLSIEKTPQQEGQ